MATRLSVTFVFLGALFVLSTIPTGKQPGDSAFVSLIASTPRAIQKSLHVLLYAVLAGLWAWTLQALAMKTSLRLLLAFLLTVGFGAAMEWCQTRIPGRFGTSLDVLLNAVGAAAGLFFAWVWL